MIIVFTFSVAANAQINKNISDPLLTNLISGAVKCNPQMKAAHKRWRAAINAISPARALPDPQILYQNENTHPHGMVAGAGPVDILPESQTMYGLGQAIPFPGKLYVRGKIASIEAKRAYEEYRVTYFQIISQLKQLYFELRFTNEAINILQRNKFILKQFEKTTHARYSVGQSPQQDIFRAQVEVSRILMRLVLLNQERKSLEANINRLLNRPLNAMIKTSANAYITPLRYNLTQLSRLLERNSPQLQVQLRNVARSNQAVQLSKMDYLPDVEISAMRVYEQPMNMQGYQVNVSATVPLYFFAKQNYELRKTLREREAAFYDLDSVKLELLFDVKDSFLKTQRSAELVTLIRHAIIPQAALTLSAAQASYRTGKVDFLTLLNSLLTLQDNELELRKEIAEHEKAKAQLEAVIGETM